MKDLVKLLNREVANFGVLYTKLHNYHWLVTGNQFYRLHELFENLYDEVTEHFDAVAERILMLEAKPLGTLKEFLENATISEAAGNETADEMLQATIADFEKLNEEFYEIVGKAQDLGDEVTVDLAIGILSSLQKHIWMLKATLG
ncbi:MAG: DNA starvation/stationary phase protection protein [Candidatus Izemoplasmatales bacterium]|jgi:starvation-inducible DNA-binding protein|nr:DNA starvation/stationary phase protection protein [Bacilli bacterium]HPZ28079.1 DNA starvation/stationary phase protection protein [Bacilli bacterium]HQC90476.1 DNA starvation/stationary phase protection protein [Bacilli bacterium]